MQNIILYAVAIALVLASFLKDRQKTKKALMKAWKSFENIMPQFLGIFVLIGIVLAILNPQIISKIIGGSSGWLGVLLASLVGAITLIPGFIAFPLSAMLLQGGAGYMQIGAFISSLMMVGVVTLPLEIRYFGRKAALMRNLLAFVFSLFVAFVIGKVVGSV
jgi:uncharacterized membrane protein YraQ (UPF0718 family)